MGNIPVADPGFPVQCLVGDTKPVLLPIFEFKQLKQNWSKGGRAAFGPAVDYNQTQTDYRRFHLSFA